MFPPEEQTPIYKKAIEIQQLIFSLISLIKDSHLPEANPLDLESIDDILEEMRSIAVELPIFIATASQDSLPYDYRMEQAIFAKKDALDVLINMNDIEDMGLKDVDYIDLLHDEIEALRLLYPDWIKSFDLWKYSNDDNEDWGLFNIEGMRFVEGKMFIDEDDFDEFDEEDDDDDFDINDDNLK